MKYVYERDTATSLDGAVSFHLLRIEPPGSDPYGDFQFTITSQAGKRGTSLRIESLISDDGQTINIFVKDRHELRFLEDSTYGVTRESSELDRLTDIADGILGVFAMARWIYLPTTYTFSVNEDLLTGATLSGARIRRPEATYVVVREILRRPDEPKDAGN